MYLGNISYLCKIKKGDTAMAIAIKAIPTLYGEEARRFREMADEVERRYALRPKRDITKTPEYVAMREMLKRSGF